MRRKKFIMTLGSIPLMAGLRPLKSMDLLMEPLNEDITMPVLFMGHGNPMNAVEDNAFTNG